ncbi:N-acetyl-gamma-glutamyl-phosphate reductase [Methanosalsum natronophilum]|uniref:N-acetyl-gamma-glutamyl-phosphate reductase n=1 Tax=Methanosalsum natronophilum TaxID=768733 RepID=A0A3R7VXX2_9EURY|nr:N-acetyl-gamma-glutamyl-phosphate reductase [Methanosalsum natronophilum]MCS3924149.1 N-acetyl-gamma-glutamyl-phosphate reductase [Methanosalsum natronophilum]RQD84656.1 MAG: N-acetyl-gamma-glutamyl-phosphate reductase [Methanosalsum natronophilum]
MLNAGIIGASGYTGGELIRLLAHHPNVNVNIATSRKLHGTYVSEQHKNLVSLNYLRFEDVEPEKITEFCDIVFLAVPHGASMKVVPKLIDSDVKIIDLSADYRLDVDIFEHVYGQEHEDPRDVPYGLVELHPEVSNSDFVSNPGCYPTGANLAAAPLVNKKIVESVVFDSKSGISGAGIVPTTTSHYPNLAENITAYKLTKHRHRAEINQELQRFDSGLTNISFTPHVIPSIRGILTTAHIFLQDKMEHQEVFEIYKKFYCDNNFIRVIEGVPSISHVRGSNFCDIGLEIDENNNRVVVVSAIDNLVKGASGQAIQNMNLMCGLEETTGLWFPGLLP